VGVARVEGRVRLFGREREQRRIEELLEHARSGESAALVVLGEPGIGKSALLDYARDHRGEGVVLSARGVEAEAELAFATLQELVRSALGLLEALPAPQAAALSSALALGSPRPADRFAIGAATLSLLAGVAEEQPVLAIVDDVSWADPSSRDALLFAARRLRAERVVMLFAVRETERALLSGSGLEELELTPLPPEACQRLIAHARHTEVAAPVGDRLASVTGGNPLAVLQIAALLDTAQLAGRVQLPEPLPAVEIEAAFLAQASDLPDESQRLLVVAAASESGAMDEIGEAVGLLGLDAGAVTAAEEAGLVSVEAGGLRFQHPLLRSALYHRAPVDERRSAHAALADVLAAKHELERRAWHLAAAATAPAEMVAAVLAEAGERAAHRGDHAAAAAAFERAARMTPIGPEKVVRLLAAAEAAQLAGRFDFAAGLLDEALSDIPQNRRSDAIRLRAAVDLWRGRPRAARQLLLAEAIRVEAEDPALAAAMLLDAAIPAVMSLEVEAAAETALRARAIAERADANTQALAAAVAGACLVGRGDVHQGGPLLECARPLVEETLPSAQAPPMIRHFVWHLYIVLGWYGDAARLYDAAIEGARAASMPALLPFPLAFRAELRFRTGNWHGAFVDASESALLAEQTGQWTQLPHSLSLLARIEAGRGDEDNCRAHCARALALAQEQGSDAIRAYTALALGLLELGLGRSTEAVAELEPAARLLDARRASPAAIPLQGDLIEARIRAGRPDDAEDALGQLERWALGNSHSWMLAACARCRGLLAREEDIDARFGEALDHHERTTTVFERARTQLAYGERLRRARRLIEAREPLHAALAAFDELGAWPWAERARAELRAARDVPREPKPAGVEQLTAQELQVARLVTAGSTNREAAAALFLSPKTIDFHLRNVYRKLGLRSRTELSRLLGTPS
jgi:DNA-binding CsgD family transcriptional regulator